MRSYQKIYVYSNLQNIITMVNLHCIISVDKMTWPAMQMSI